MPTPSPAKFAAPWAKHLGAFGFVMFLLSAIGITLILRKNSRDVNVQYTMVAKTNLLATAMNQQGNYLAKLSREMHDRSAAATAKMAAGKFTTADADALAAATADNQRRFELALEESTRRIKLVNDSNSATAAEQARYATRQHTYQPVFWILLATGLLGEFVWLGALGALRIIKYQRRSLVLN